MLTAHLLLLGLLSPFYSHLSQTLYSVCSFRPVTIFHLSSLYFISSFSLVFISSLLFFSLVFSFAYLYFISSSLFSYLYFVLPILLDPGLLFSLFFPTQILLLLKANFHAMANLHILPLRRCGPCLH